ncbi:MAG: hypothetical protein K8R23_20120 [Chthoniobacter sp.]|nr:hypothetical protein [Chthoniobacter sp.]
MIKIHAPLKGVALLGARVRATFSEEQIEAAKREAYQRGSDEARRLIERQMIEQRAELVHLQTETFAAVARQHEGLARQLYEMLPELALEAVARILARTDFDREMVLGITRDVLAEIEPSDASVEVQLSSRDLELITGYEEDFREKHPTITFRSNPELRTGDCIVRSRYGVVDGRLATKLRTVESFLK